MDNSNLTHWLTDFKGSRDLMLSMAETLKRWADENNLEYRYTDMPDNEHGVPVLAILPKELTNEA